MEAGVPEYVDKILDALLDGKPLDFGGCFVPVEVQMRLGGRVEYCDLCGARIVLMDEDGSSGGLAVDAENPEVEHDCPGEPE